MKNQLLIGRFVVLASMLLGLPALGVLLKGEDIWLYLEFPPVNQFVSKAGFSWIAFGIFLILILFTLSLLIAIFLKSNSPESRTEKGRFPWWGWVGCTALILFWSLAWNRFEWMGSWQEHTFFPLWACYIVIINALTLKRTGSCMMTDQTAFFLSLFPISAIFWWFFEYLNRFVQNWSYTAVHYSPAKYFLLATLAFSTVLPSVLGTCRFLMSFPRIKEGLRFNIPFQIHRPEIPALAGLFVAAAGLGLIGVFPDYLFPLLWVSPLVILLSLKTLFKEEHLLHLHRSERQPQFIAAMLSALICGFFWEMWNYWSMIKWTYAIPFVDRFRLFEMPILGYSGYLPFGLECVIIGETIREIFSRKPVNYIGSSTDSIWG